MTGNDALISGGDTASYVSGSWTLIDEITGKTYVADAELHQQNEQVFLDLGISINMKSIYSPGPYKLGEKPDGSETVAIYENLADNNGLLESTISYADSSVRWLSGVEDNNIPGSSLNWIRSGTYQGDLAGSNDWNMPSKPFDPLESYEKIINGTWSPYLLCAASEQDAVGPAYSLNSKQFATMTDIGSVDIVLTPDKTKWSRSVVVEMCPDKNLSQGGIERFKFRVAPSVDKDGNPAQAGSGPSENPEDPNYISDSGMGWFPGYAINIETGERLNVMFGEDSWLAAENGRDMLFNPTTTIYDDQGNPRFGGKHYVYVMDHSTRNLQGLIYPFPAYDACRFIRNGYELHDVPAFLYENAWYSTTMYVGIPLADDPDTWLDNEAKIRIRVGKPYQRYYSIPLDSASIANSRNRHLPLYKFETESVATTAYDPEKAENDLDLIQAVPNPYYAYAGGPGYERNALDNRIKITNLPERCIVTIYNVQGTLIRQITKDEPKTSIDWDLKNHAGVPIAGGVYIIHVKAPEGEKIIKWFGGLRKPDLNVF